MKQIKATDRKSIISYCRKQCHQCKIVLQP